MKNTNLALSWEASSVHQTDLVKVHAQSGKPWLNMGQPLVSASVSRFLELCDRLRGSHGVG